MSKATVADRDVAVGVVGLGQMGNPMARRIHHAGSLTMAHDLKPEVAESFTRGTGIRVAQSLAEVGRGCDVVILMLPNGDVVHQAVLGGGGDEDCLAANAADGLIIIDMSSSAPMGTRALGQTLANRGIQLLDAPVSGGVKKAESGELTIMVGGDPGLVERLRWLFESMGRRIFATGPLGSGHALKALNNYVSAAGLAAAAEALHIAEAFGIDGEVMVDVLNASTGRNNSTENKFKQYILSRTYASGFALDLMAKDLATATELAEQSGVFAPLIKHCSGLWQEASKNLGKGADHTEYVRYQLSEEKH
jgi:3-hydroxyisobutyrate dehydrogenase